MVAADSVCYLVPLLLATLRAAALSGGVGAICRMYGGVVKQLPYGWGAEAQGAFTGSPVDLADGFIHFSTAEQVEETARRHFADQTDLVLVTVDPDKLVDALKWEPSRGGALFPHLYGGIHPNAVTATYPVIRDEAGQFLSIEFDNG